MKAKTTHPIPRHEYLIGAIVIAGSWLAMFLKAIGVI